MGALRSGSYSSRSTTPLMPSMSRRKSMRRYFCRDPPPTWRVVIRPKWLRAPVLFWCTVSDSSGPPLSRWPRATRTTKRVPGEVGLSLISAMVEPSGLARGGFVIDALALGQADVGFLPVLRAARRLAEAPRLARLVEHLHGGDLDVEHQFDRCAHFRARGIAADPERVLVAQLQPLRGLFGDVRGDQHAHQPLGAGLRRRLAHHDAHCRRSSISFTAPTVASTLSWLARLSGLTAAAASTSTPGRLRAARNSFSSSASTMISTLARSRDLSWLASRRVLGASRLMPSVTSRRSWRTSSENMARSAPRYILRLTFWVKSRGLAAKARPPPTQMGLRIEPAREVPPPFCVRGLPPPPRTSARVFCALVPARPAPR